MLLLKPQNLVFLLLVVVGVLYSQTVGSLYFLWIESGNPAYSHGSLAFLIALYIFAKFWFSKKNPTDSLIAIKLDVFGLLLLLGATVLWMLATLGNIQVIQQLALLGIVGFIFWGAFGFSVFRKLAVPLLIMLSTIPVWDFMDYYLQHITAVGVSLLLNLTTIPFVKEGVHILLQSGTFEIADRCSGLRMLTAMVPVALLYCYQWNFRPLVTSGYVLFSILVAIFANVIRILIVVIAGHLTEMKHYFVTTDHVTLGWVVFGVIVLLFIFLSNKILLTEKLYPKLRNKNGQTEVADSSVQGSDDSLLPASNTSIATHGNYLVLLTVGLTVVVGPALAKTFSYSNMDVPVSVELDAAYGQWREVDKLFDNWKPQYYGQDLEKWVHFQTANGDRAQFYLAYYYHQAQGKEAVHFENKLFDSDKWQKFSDRRLTRSISGIGNIALREIKIQSLAGQKKLIWQWYFIGGNRTNSASKTKLYEILGKVTGNPAMSVIIVATDIDGGEEAAVEKLTNFTTAILTTVERKLGDIRQ